MRARSRQLEVRPARREARVLEGEVDEEAPALLADDVARPRREDLHSHGGSGLGRRALAGGRRRAGRSNGHDGDEGEGQEQLSGT
jgi:hypothetical protein